MSEKETLVERLRRRHPTPLEREAANEIERLTADLEGLRNNYRAALSHIADLEAARAGEPTTPLMRAAAAAADKVASWSPSKQDAARRIAGARVRS